MIRPRVVIHNFQHVSAQQREHASLTAHEVGAHENLQSLDRVVRSQPGDFVCRSRVIKDTKAPTRQARNLGLCGVAAGAALAGLAFLPGLGVALVAGGLAAMNQWKLWANPSSIASLPKGKVEITHGHDKSPSSKAEPTASDFLKKGMKQYPKAQHVVMVSGHGHTGSVGDFSFRDLAGELKDSQKNMGQRPSLLVFKSCSVGQLENVAELTGTADAAVMSSVPIASMGYPLEEAFHTANFTGNGSNDATAIANTIKAETSDTWVSMEDLGFAKMGSHHTQSIDLKKLETETLPALDQLGECLQLELLAGRRDVLKRAAAKAIVESPQTGGQAMRFDLRSTLLNLKDADVSESTHRTIERTLKDWPVSGNEGELGISFHLAPKQSAIRKSAPKWCTFVDSFRSSLLESRKQD